MAKLSSSALRSIMTYVVFTEDEVRRHGIRMIEPPEGAVIVQGVMNKFGLHPGRLKEKREEIRELLAEVPDDFMRTGGGGMSFLNLCMDRHGNHWGEHVNYEDLIVLGMGVGMVNYCVPRDMWSSLPGGMPYVTVDITVP